MVSVFISQSLSRKIFGYSEIGKMFILYIIMAFIDGQFVEYSICDFNFVELTFWVYYCRLHGSLIHACKTWDDEYYSWSHVLQVWSQA